MSKIMQKSECEFINEENANKIEQGLEVSKDIELTSSEYGKVDINWQAALENMQDKLGIPSLKEIRLKEKERNKKWADKRKRRNLKLQKRKQRSR